MQQRRSRNHVRKEEREGHKGSDEEEQFQQQHQKQPPFEKKTNKIK